MSFNVNGYNPYQQKSFPYGAPQRPLPYPGVQASGLIGAPSYLLPSAASTSYNKPQAYPPYSQQGAIQRPANSLPFRPVGPHGAFYSHSSLMPGVMPNSRLMPGPSGATIHNNYYTNPTDPPEVRQKKDIKKFVLNTIAAAMGGFLMLGIGLLGLKIWKRDLYNFFKEMGDRPFKAITAFSKSMRSNPKENVHLRTFKAFSEAMREWNSYKPPQGKPFSQRLNNGIEDLFNFIFRRKPTKKASTTEPTTKSTSTGEDWNFDSAKDIIPNLSKIFSYGAKEVEKMEKEGTQISQIAKDAQEAAAEAKEAVAKVSKLTNKFEEELQTTRAEIMSKLNPSLDNFNQASKNTIDLTTQAQRKVDEVSTKAHKMLDNGTQFTQDAKNTFTRIKPTVESGVKTFKETAESHKELADNLHASHADIKSKIDPSLENFNQASKQTVDLTTQAQQEVEKVSTKLNKTLDNCNNFIKRLNADYDIFVPRVNYILSRVDTILNDGTALSAQARKEMDSIWPRIKIILSKTNKAANQGKDVTNTVKVQLEQFITKMEAVLKEEQVQNIPARMNGLLTNAEASLSNISTVSGVFSNPGGALKSLWNGSSSKQAEKAAEKKPAPQTSSIATQTESSAQPYAPSGSAEDAFEEVFEDAVQYPSQAS